MDTFIEPGPFEEDPGFFKGRTKSLKELEEALKAGEIDSPIIPLIKIFSEIGHCYTLQCCYGHFVHEMEQDIHNLEPLEQYAGRIAEVNYRIAYVALVIGNSRNGRMLFDDLKKITEIDPGYIQFGSAEWFWKQHVNSYAIQLEPDRGKYMDEIIIPFEEGLHIEKIRIKFLSELQKVAEKHRLLSVE